MAQMTCYEFGAKLLDLNDLDPVYVVLHEADLEDEMLRRWLLAYWCFYHAGTASWCTFGDLDYWPRMETAAASKEYPRCRERRHFRGANAINSVAFLKSKGIMGLWGPFIHKIAATARWVMDQVQQWTGFGPWISFKVADMLERLGLLQVDFDLATAMYDSPMEGAIRLWDQYNPPTRSYENEPGGVGGWAVGHILAHLGHNMAPPLMEREINLQEVETILCKWNSYCKGHYHLGEDVTGLRQSLIRFSKCPLAQQLLKAGKRSQLW